MSTVWDVPPELPTPAHDPVDGKIPDGGGGGGPTLNLGVFADLALSIGSLASRVDRAIDAYEAGLRKIPGDYQFAQSGVYPSSGNLLLDLGTPAQGQFWQVRCLIVGGSDITTTPAGTAWVVVQGSAANTAGQNVNLANVKDFTSGTFPQRAFYGTHEVIVLPGEHLYVVVTAGTSTTQYTASMKAEVFDTAATYVE